MRIPSRKEHDNVIMVKKAPKKGEKRAPEEEVGVSISWGKSDVVDPPKQLNKLPISTNFLFYGEKVGNFASQFT